VREINGYSVEYTAFHSPLAGSSSPASTTIPDCLVYIGLPSNPQFLGPQDPDALAAHIARSKGPSGENSEYLYNLAAALQGVRGEAGVGVGGEDIDEHVSDLAARVRREEERLWAEGKGKVGAAREGSGEEETVEEVEGR